MTRSRRFSPPPSPSRSASRFPGAAAERPSATPQSPTDRTASATTTRTRPKRPACSQQACAHQYTPYFNDGETCVFGASSLWIRTVADADVEIDDGDELSMWAHPSLSGSRWEGGRKVTYDVTMPDTARAAHALDQAIDRGSADAVLLELFGDHANVTVTKSGISVEFYSHD